MLNHQKACSCHRRDLTTAMSTSVSLSIIPICLPLSLSLSLLPCFAFIQVCPVLCHMLKETLVYANISLQSVSPRWERWLNPSHLKWPISAGRCGGLVRHITPVRLHWVSVFCSVHEGHRSSCGALAHGHSGKLSTQTHTRTLEEAAGKSIIIL